MIAVFFFMVAISPFPLMIDANSVTT
jgi:hypothetical protein